jgi:hypothetical protein
VSGLRVSGLKVEAVQLIPTESTGKATMLGNAIDDEKKQMGILLWKACDVGGWESRRRDGLHNWRVL